MAVSTSLHSVARTLSAPYGSTESMSTYGANHLNDGKPWIYIFTCGIAKLYELYNEKSMALKARELMNITYAIRQQLDKICGLKTPPKSIDVGCVMNGNKTTLKLEKSGDHIVISIKGAETGKVVVKYHSFNTLLDKLNDELNTHWVEEESSMEVNPYIETLTFPPSPRRFTSQPRGT